MKKVGKYQQGFSLIELMVVITIIGVLSSIVFVSLENARAIARDTQRLSDMNELAKAFEMFYIDEGRYPGASDGVPNSGQIIGVGNEIDIALSPYIDPVPIDPKHDAGTGKIPPAGATYFYGYDPQHLVNVLDASGNPACSDNPAANPGWTWDAGITFGFNRAEIKKDLRKDTCSGSNINLNNADYNRASTPVGT